MKCNTLSSLTDFNNAAIRNNTKMKTFLSGLSPLKRVGNANDIGSMVAFLCSDDAKWVNGQRIEVSGGINLYLCKRLVLDKPFVISFL